MAGLNELWIDPHRDAVRMLADQTTVLAEEAQELFAEKYAAYPWQVDLSGTPRFWFEREPIAEFRAHFIGSVSEYSNTWMWGWENINGYPEEAVALSTSVRDAGERLDCPEFTTTVLPLDPRERSDAGLPAREHAVYDYVHAAMALTDLVEPVYYRGSNGNGGYAWFVLENRAEFHLPPASIMSAVGILTRITAAGLVADPHLATWAYAVRREGLTIEQTGTDMILTAQDGSATVSFDDRGRLARIDAHAGPAAAGGH
ncbi:hypothetical protein HWD35_06610 [Tsukamurella tyrosinosolvens]|uniref:DUF6882 domain-containing protein n=2 Tax=Tsukamurella tyrosinosolvens TaxID=57704 RepID=UPI000B202B8E|nr:DUF6882 domain-containing protein [Tsukamurella tyrosinosolvens]MCA4994375.1 hypothetical protein [Tsukamurella tyrosinosolvens]RDB48218.1 hypothetical protein DVB87_09085 [Tsukamurella tyrosinosolvens]